MSQNGGYTPDYSGLGDPYMAIALQQQLMPEYSVSKGWLPVDQGTLKGQVNLNQDLWQNYTDPFQMAYAGALDPRAFEPTYDDSDMPEAPDLAQLELYRNSGDPVMKAIILGLQDGIPPYDVIESMKEEGLLPADQEVPQADGSVKRMSDPRADALLAEATNLQSQIAAESKYTRDMETYQPKEVPSALAQQFIDAGLPLPTLQYTPESLDPDLPDLWSGVEALHGERDALGQETERVRDITRQRPAYESTGLMEDDRGIMRPTWDGKFNDENKRPLWAEPVTKDKPMGGGRSAGRVRNKAMKDDKGRSARKGAQDKWLGAAQRAANGELLTLLRQAEANSAARIAQAQGRTPYKDAIARAAGPGF